MEAGKPIEETPETLEASQKRAAAKDGIAAPDDLSLKPGNAAADLAAIAKANEPKADPAPTPEAPPQDGPEPEPAQPESLEQAAATPAEDKPAEAPESPAEEEVTVPAKFVGKDGKVNEAAVKKSTAEAVKTLLKLEKDVGRAFSEKSQTPIKPPADPQTGPTADPLEVEINKALAADPKNPGKVLAQCIETARLQAVQDARQEWAKEVGSVRDTQHAATRERQLEALARDYPEYVADGGKRVFAMMESNPHLWHSPTPYADAVDKCIAEDARSGRQVLKPVPKGAAGAPVPPATPVNRVKKNAPKIDQMSQAELREATKDMSEEDFLKSSGIRVRPINRG